MSQPIRILLLEDVPTDAELNLRELRKSQLHFTSHIAETKQEFLYALETFQPDIILSDHSLPQFSSREAMRIAQSQCPSAIIILVTGSLSEEFAMDALHSGAHDYILKSNLTRLPNAIENALAKRKAEREKEEAVASLSKQEKYFRSLFENASDIITVLDATGTINYHSPSVEKILGYSSDELLGKNVFQFIHPDEQERMKQTFESAFQQLGIIHSATYRFRHKNGAWLYLESTGKAAYTNGNTEAIVNSRDITEKKKLEEQYLRAQRMESVGTLAGGIAHDLNNILAPILLAISMFRRKFTDEQSQKLLDTMEKGAQRGANLIKQILSFARGIEGEKQLMQLRHIIMEIDKMMKETFSRSLTIVTNVPKELWTINADATQMHQVLMNICVNARDAMPNGGTLSLAAENFWIDEQFARMNLNAKVGPYILVSISDTGTGMPPEVCERIFEPFYTTKEHGKGTGLGLSTVFNLVKSHDGFINVYSEIGNGTTFKIYLPALPNVDQQSNDIVAPELIRGNGETLLVIDDEQSIREITKATLESADYVVLTANNGAEGVVTFAAHHQLINAVILDMNMPIMDGVATIHALRAIDGNVKIIGASGSTKRKKIVEEVEKIHAFLSKPFQAEKLLQTIHNVLAS